jgi:hypothetical protein
MSKSNAANVAAYRARQKEQGMVRLEFYVPMIYAEAIKAFVKQITGVKK